MTPSLTPPEALVKSRGALTFVGIFFILVGMFAIGFPYAASLAIVQVIAIILVISGVFSIGAAAFGHDKKHRIATILLAFIRLVIGVVLFADLKSGVQVITLVLVIFFLAEGVTFIISALALRHNRAWLLMLLNGIVAIVLAGMIWRHFPASADWATGLLYGINSIFYGVTLIGFATSHAKPA